MTSMFDITSGPFAEAKKDAFDFCHNLFLSNAVHECVERMIKIEKERDIAILNDDQELVQQKELELMTFQQSLTLTAIMLDSSEEFTT